MNQSCLVSVIPYYTQAYTCRSECALVVGSHYVIKCFLTIENNVYLLSSHITESFFRWQKRNFHYWLKYNYTLIIQLTLLMYQAFKIDTVTFTTIYIWLSGHACHLKRDKLFTLMHHLSKIVILFNLHTWNVCINFSYWFWRILVVCYSETKIKDNNLFWYLSWFIFLEEFILLTSA